MRKTPKTPDDNRTERLPQSRVTLAEKLLIEERAALAGLTLTEFCRRAALHGKIVVKQKGGGVPVGLLSDLARIGNNLNQITKAAHATGYDPAPIPALADDIRELIERIADIVMADERPNDPEEVRDGMTVAEMFDDNF